MRVWDRFLTERDRAHLATLQEPPRVGFGRTPALLLIDHSRAALGEERLRWLQSIERYALSMGPEAWDAVDRTEAAYAMSLFDLHQKDADVLRIDEVMHWLNRHGGGIAYAPERGELAVGAHR